MSNLSNVVGKAAPALGAAIGGPIGLGVGSIIGGIATLFGGDADDPDNLSTIIEKDPNAALKLREFELTHLAALETISANRVRDAQQREIAYTTTTGKRDWLLAFLVVAIVVGFFGCIGIVAFTTADKTDRDLFYTLLGTLTFAFSSVVSYYLGATYPKEAQQRVVANYAPVRSVHDK